MATYPKTVRFGKFLVELGDGATPTEAFVAPCGFTERALRINAATGSTVVPACDAPDAPAWEEKDVTSQSWQVTGTGVIDLHDLETWRDWALVGGLKNVRVRFDDTLANGGGYYQGAGVLTTFEQAGQRGQRGTLSVTIDSSGPLAWTDAAA